MANTVTSANVSFFLSIANVASTAVQLQQFAVDDAFLFENVDAAEVQVGVDGYGVGGFVPRAPMMPIRFLSPSPSATLFDNWLAAQDQIGDLLYAAGVLTYPSVSLKFTLYRGTLLRTNTAPPARKILGFREYTVQWLPQGTIPAISGAPF